MSIFDKLFGTKPAEAPAEHAVVVHFEYGSTDLSRLFDLERQLDSELQRNGAGEVDGNEVATDGSDGFLYMYGTDADALFAVARPFLEAAGFMRGARVKLRYGPAGSGARERHIVLE